MGKTDGNLDIVAVSSHDYQFYNHRRMGRGGGLQPPQNLGNLDFFGQQEKFGQSQF